MKILSWKVTRTNRKLLNQILDRAEKMFPMVDRESLSMDLIACHNNGCPLDFKKFLKADDFNFVHDVVGIQNHINRQTGEISRFHPRMALPRK